jgi:hypothetical protein
LVGNFGGQARLRGFDCALRSPVVDGAKDGFPSLAPASLLKKITMERERSPEEIREAAIADLKAKMDVIRKSDILMDFQRAVVSFADKMKVENPDIKRTALYHAVIGSSSWREASETPSLDLDGEPVARFVDEWYEKAKAAGLYEK